MTLVMVKLNCQYFILQWSNLLKYYNFLIIFSLRTGKKSDNYLLMISFLNKYNAKNCNNKVTVTYINQESQVLNDVSLFFHKIKHSECQSTFWINISSTTFTVEQQKFTNHMLMLMNYHIKFNQIVHFLHSVFDKMTQGIKWWMTLIRASGLLWSNYRFSVHYQPCINNWWIIRNMMICSILVINLIIPAH